MNEARSITDLDPVQDVVCELLDIVEKITINGNTPTSKHFCIVRSLYIYNHISRHRPSIGFRYINTQAQLPCLVRVIMFLVWALEKSPYLLFLAPYTAL